MATSLESSSFRGEAVPSRRTAGRLVHVCQVAGPGLVRLTQLFAETMLAAPAAADRKRKVETFILFFSAKARGMDLPTPTSLSAGNSVYLSCRKCEFRLRISGTVESGR
jgi:hypothetical protein